MALLPIIEATLVALFLLTAAGAIRRLYFHPLSHIPGPKLAALTWWYEFYFDIIQPSRYVFKIQELHEEYGCSTIPSFPTRADHRTSQVQSYASHPMSSTSMTSAFSTPSTRHHPPVKTSMPTNCELSAFPVALAQLYLTMCIRDVAMPSVLFSASGMCSFSSL